MEYNIAWLEEPMPPEDHEAYRKLKEADYVPLASGEHEPNELRYMDLIHTAAVDYVQMDVSARADIRRSPVDAGDRRRWPEVRVP